MPLRRPSRPRVPPILALLFALPCTLPWVSACSGTPETEDPFGGPQGRSEVRIEVANVNFLDATLHALYDGRRQRLGTVTGNTSAVFTLAWRAAAPLQIEIDLLAGGSCVTREILVGPGEEIELQIESNLSMTQACR